MVLAVALQVPNRSPANPCGAQPARLLPVDQAATQPDFFTFRARLQAAIARRDEAAVIAAADPGIRTSFGDDEGIATFRAKLRDPQDAVWATWRPRSHSAVRFNRPIRSRRRTCSQPGPNGSIRSSAGP